MLADLRLAIRLLLKAPAFTLVSILALALGIGANTLMFSVANTVLFRSLAYRDPDALVYVNSVQEASKSAIGSSPPDFYTLRANNRSFDGVAGLYARPMNLVGAQAPQRLRVLVVSSNLLDVLGVAPALGRGFSRDDESWGSHRVALLSDALWRARFGGDPSIVGKTITLSAQPHTVVGVLPAAFSWLGSESQVVVPMSFEPGDNLNSHNNYFIGIVARLKRGVAIDAARGELREVARRIQEQFPESRGVGLDLEPLRDGLVGEVRPAILVLLGAVAFVLLIACGNLANLMLVRAEARRREIAVRVALGAARGRIVRQLLTESGLLAVVGGAAGLLLAVWGVDAVNALGQNVLPRMQPVRIDGAVLAFTLLVALATGLMFGLAPALHGSAVNPRDQLNEAATTGSGARRRLSAALVIAEVALSLVLLSGAGLMLKSVHRLLSVEPGFDPAGVLTAEFNLPREKYVDAQLERAFKPEATARAARFFDELIGRMRALPGVRHAGAISQVPMLGGTWGKRLVLWDRPLPASGNELPQIQYRVIAGDAFGALGIRLLRGRAFRDVEPEKVAIVSKELARRHFGGDALGKVISTNSPRELNPVDTLPPDWRPDRFTIVGIVDDVRYSGLDKEPQPSVYVSYAQAAEGNLTMFLALRTDGDPLSLVGAVRDEARRVDSEQPVHNVATMDSRVSRWVAQRRLQAGLLGGFAAIAVLLAAIGIYGVMAVAVSQRTREIGIRMALGAVDRDVVAMVVRQGLTLAVAGVALGLFGALALTRVMQSLLFSVSATDPVVLGSIAALLACVLLLASYLPARRAAKVDPMVALRG